MGIAEPLGTVFFRLLSKPTALVIAPGIVVYGGVQQFWGLAAVVVDLHEIGERFTFPAAVGHAAHAPAKEGIAPAHDQFALLGADAVGGVVGLVRGNGHRTDGIAMEVEHELAVGIITAVGVGVKEDKVAAGMGPGVIADHIHYF